MLDFIMETSDSDTKHNDITKFAPKEKWCGHEFLYEFHGFWFTETYLQTTLHVIQTFKPLPTDVILASFPKTGTTWLKALLHSITHRSISSSSSSQNDTVSMLSHPQELVPSLETNLYVRKRTQGVRKMQEFLDEKEGRILATHAPHQIIGDVLNSCDPKIVYVTRNPKDTLISMWRFVQKLKDVGDDHPWELEAAVDQFCKGIVPFGPYYDHVLAYKQESLKRPSKMLFVTYEELKEDPRKHVRKLGEFLGCPFGGENGEDEVEKIVKMCSFEVLSNQGINKSSELPDSGFPLPYNSFFRRGEVGDHLRYLEVEMIRKIDDVTRLKFHASGFEYGI